MATLAVIIIFFNKKPIFLVPGAFSIIIFSNLFRKAIAVRAILIIFLFYSI